MDINWGPIIEAVIAVIVAVVAYVLIPYIKSKTTAAQQEALSKIIDVLVAAAEQLFPGSGRGPEKKAHVVEALEEMGIKVDSTKNARIEAAVYGLGKNTTPEAVAA